MERASLAKDILWLAMCWALTLTTSTLLTTIAPLSADELGASTVAAPFTIGVFLFGAAFSSVPSGPLFRKYGRLKGFSVGCLCQVIGSVLGAGGMVFESLPLVFAGCFFAGLGQGLGQFYRFSAVEIAPQDFKSQAVTYVLSGGVIAAFLGPTTAKYTSDLVGRNYLGSYLFMGIIGIINQICVMMVNFPAPPSKSELNEKLIEDEDAEERKRGALAGTNAEGANLGADDDEAALVKSQNLQLSERRPLMEIISQPLFIISCAVATIAHTQMVMLMSNCSLAMSLKYDYSFTNTARVMEVHFFTMFAPGFFTGKLIERYGAFLVALLGAVVYGAAAVVFLSGTELWNFFVGMGTLGVAWNFSFSAGTVMLTGSYRKSEATDVQAINDFILFTVAGVGSLLSGLIYSTWGWFVLVYAVSGMCVFNIVLFAMAWRLKKAIEDSIRDAELDDEDEGGDKDVEGTDKGGLQSDLDQVGPLRMHAGGANPIHGSGSTSSGGAARSPEYRDLAAAGPIDISGRNATTRQHASHRLMSKDSASSRASRRQHSTASQRSLVDLLTPEANPEHTGVEVVRSVSVA